MNEFFRGEAFLQFFQSRVGKIAIAIWSFFLLRQLGWHHVGYFSLAIILIGFFPQRRNLMVAVFSIGYWLFIYDFDPYIGPTEVMQTFASFQTHEYPKVLVRGVSLAAALVYIGSLTWLFVDRLSLRHPVIAYVCAHVTLCLSLSLISRKSPFFAFSAGFIVVSSIFFGFACYFVRDRKYLSHRPIWQLLSTVYPFFTNAYVPLKGNLELRDKEAKDDRSFAQTQLSGIKLLFSSMVIMLVGHLVFTAVFDGAAVALGASLKPSLRWPFAGHITYFAFNTLQPPTYMYWATLIGQTASFLVFEITVPYGVFVGLARCCGYNLFRHVYKPVQSAGINDFFGRIMYYYNAMIVDLFLIPAWLQFRFLAHRKQLRMFLSVFVAVTAGGALIHFVRDSYEMIRLGPWGSVIEFATVQMPYFTAFGLISGAAAVVKTHSHRWAHTKSFQLGAFAMMFLVYCFLLSLNYNHSDAALAEKFVFYRRLCGL